MQQMETLPSGTILCGRYRVERALGSGGFGHVYLSVDLQTNTQYAIKEYLVTGASGKAQLEHEAQVLSHLHHPNLPAFLSAFDENGRYYVVLGYIEGNDLTDYIRVVRQKNEPIPIARLMEWLLSICDAVAFLHSQHPPIIHRDIKPDNIRITPSGTAILVDLGNAKTAADGARTLFFIRHQGTPGYAPLEQYPGGTGTDERSDVYALGGTLYFALTAHEPPSVSARNQALQQKQPDLPTLQDRLAQNPPENVQEPRQFRLGVSKPSKPTPRHSRHLAQLGTLPPELLRKLDAIIQRAMAMKPKDRYQSVADFSNDLKIVLRALPASTIPASPNRPVDPHSTQPDLPMLYEEMQKQKQASNAQTSQQKSGSPAQTNQQQRSAPSAQPSQQKPTARSTAAGQSQTPPSTSLRCPSCHTELNRPAPYCPHCGTPLNAPAPARNSPAPSEPGQRYGSKNTAQDISDEATMLFPPRATSTSSREQPAPNRRPASPDAQTPARGGTNAHLPSLRAPRQQQMLKTPSQPVPAVQAEKSAPAASASADATLKPAGVNSSNISAPAEKRETVKPFMAPSSADGQSQAQSSPSTAGQSNQPDDATRRLFISLAMVVVALIIIMLLLIVFLRGKHLIGMDGPVQHVLVWTRSTLEKYQFA
jgi:serine/threonine protein kinase